MRARVADRLRENLLLNSDFFLWVRGTATTVSNGSTAYLADRWYARNALGTGGVLTYSRQAGTFAPFAARLQVTTAPTAAHANGCELYQTLDNTTSLLLYNRVASFRIQVRALGNVNAVGVQFMYKTTAAKVDTPLGAERVVAVNTSEYSAAAIDGQEIGTAPTPTGVVGVRIRIVGVSSGNPYDLNNGFQVEQAMLNEGPSAGPWQRACKFMNEELAACQRFYQEGIAAAGGGSNAVASHTPVNFAVHMRTDPSVDISTVIADQNVQPPQANNITGFGFRFSCQRSSPSEFYSTRRYKANAEI